MCIFAYAGDFTICPLYCRVFIQDPYLRARTKFIFCNVLFEFIAGIKENSQLLCGAAPLDKETREKFALSLTTELEVTKDLY